jgi:hypothetical protein
VQENAVHLCDKSIDIIISIIIPIFAKHVPYIFRVNHQWNTQQYLLGGSASDSGRDASNRFLRGKPLLASSAFLWWGLF